MVSPGGFTEIVVLTISHGLANNAETVALNGTGPAGISVGFVPSNMAQLQPSVINSNVTLDLTASSSAAVGNDTITINGASGTDSQSVSFTLRVVQDRVVIVHNIFTPAKLNVTVGSTVYWQNLDGPLASGCGESTGSGVHSVVFTTIPGANSSTITQFGVYSYTFTTPGSYFYYSSLDSDHSVNGTINVLGAGGTGIGSVSILPTFSQFKGGVPATIQPVPIPGGTQALPRASALQDGPASLRLYSPSAPIQAIAFGLAALGAALATAAIGKRRTEGYVAATA